LNQSDLEYFVRNQGAGRHVCPVCSPDRKKKNEKTLNIQPDAGSILFQCWHCELSGKVSSDKKDDWSMEPKAPVKAISFPKTSDKALADAFLRNRGIDPELVDGYQIVAGTKYFSGEGELNAIGFAYGDKEAIKWRSVEGKNFIQDGSARTLWGIENADIDNLQTVIITEGEFDCLAIVSAIDKSSSTLVVSVPNGAPQKVSNSKVEPSEDRKFAYLWSAKEVLEKAERIVLAMDDDEPGAALGEEIMRRVGRAKCYHLEIPEDCKDSNDILLRHGAEELSRLVDEAVPTPLVGVYSASDYADDVSFLYEKGLMGGLSTGFNGLDGLYTILQGQLTIVTGQPGSGKSEFIDAVLVNLAEQHQWKFAIASFENPPPMHIIKLAEKHARKPFFEGAHERMSRSELDEATGWVNDHFAFLESKDGEAATIDNIIERTKQAVMRLGCRGLVVDPYNYIAQNNLEQEHQAISEMLTRMVQFARSHDLHIWFIAHPAKMRANDQGKMPVPNGNHISGSAAWFAKADCGITVHREEAHIEVHSWKCRFKWVGSVGQADLQYDPVTGRYRDREYEHEPMAFTATKGRGDYHETAADWDF